MEDRRIEEMDLSTKNWHFSTVSTDGINWGQFMIIDINRLVISSTYQRDIKSVNVKQIVENFTPDQFGAIKVARRESKGQYYIIDGQHRAMAAQMLGIGQVPCLLVTSEGEPVEARIFKNQINRKNPNAFYIFKAAVAAGSPLECEINDWLSVVDIGLSASNKARCISFVSGLIRRWKRDSRACKDAIKTLLLIDSHVPLNGEVHAGLWYLEMNGIDTSKGVDKIKLSGGIQVLKGIAAATKAELKLASGSQSNPRLWASAIVKMINKGRSTNKIKMPSKD